MFDKAELKVLRKLNTPSKIQDYLDKLPINFEPEGETCISPRRVLREGKAHCMEGAMFAAACLQLAGKQPLLLDLKTTKHDYEHVVAPFREGKHWGAISKTNHPVLRYRDAVYGSVRELVMSYFHEYFLDTGVKTLRSYSRPFSLTRFDSEHWQTDEEDLWYIDRALDNSSHIFILPEGVTTGNLRKASPLEIKATALTQFSSTTSLRRVRQSQRA